MEARVWQRRVQVARPFLIAAVLVALISIGFLIAQLLSPDSVIWTGRCIPATLRGGLAYYVVNGEQLAVNDPTVPANSPVMPTTVCYDPANPEQALVPHAATRSFEASLVLVPLAIAIGLALYGLMVRPIRIKDIDDALPWPTRIGG